MFKTVFKIIPGGYHKTNKGTMGHTTSAESLDGFQRVDILFKVQSFGGSKLSPDVDSSPLIVSSTLQTATISATLQDAENRTLFGTQEVSNLTWRIFMALKLHEVTQKDRFIKNITSQEIVYHIHHIDQPVKRELNKYVRVCYTIASSEAADFLDKLKSLNSLLSDNVTCKFHLSQSNIPQQVDFLLNFTTSDRLLFPGSELIQSKINEASNSSSTNRVGMLARAENLALLGRTAFNAVNKVMKNKNAGNVLQTVSDLMKP